ncbi:hypothetical protein FNV43_RR17151 [Rhamnella rubrinervis]|uniref:TF-B3 domain-containing protein n=1 Tax=Rhamnella rubrinervis TaxID=2594499 RepID=A0A8K0DY91_9ROSA|nr:hypothetical protein FNV43_RR17151 [Rhamnella rubrinervis]
MAHVRPSFSSATPHFFKIVLQNALRDKKIKIPKQFVRKYGESLSSPVILRLPSGLEWKLGLSKSDGRLWLHKGWPEFAAHHSINRGHLLVFRYEGSSKFYVLILDTGATEIDYPIVNPSHLLGPKNEEVEILDDPITKTADRARALERVSWFKSENPFFTIVMELSYIHGGTRVNMPKKFAERYKDKKEGELNLRVSDGRSWSVRYLIRRVLNGSIRGEICYGGWKVFARDNHLEVGDVCIFNLINANDKAEDVFEVFVYRRTDDHESNPGSHDKAPSDCTGKDKANCMVAVNQIAEAKPKRSYFEHSQMENSQVEPKTCMALEEAASSEYPSFQVTVASKVERSDMTIPIGFARSYLKRVRNHQIVKLMVENRWWDAKLISNDRCKFSAGWRAFASDNALQCGDTFRFQMIENNPIVFQVSITRSFN